jgi:hypothetical protein
MVFGRPKQFGCLRLLGTGLLALSLVHTPLPKADFHNIRHHDGPGEACPYHEHLLSWHPNATEAADVAVLHWHWFLPLAGDSGPSSDGQTSSVHSQVPDWSGLGWESAPQLPSLNRVRFIGRSGLEGPPAFWALLGTGPVALAARGSPLTLHAFASTFAPATSLTSLLGRWNC